LDLEQTRLDDIGQTWEHVVPARCGLPGSAGPVFEPVFQGQHGFEANLERMPATGTMYRRLDMGAEAYAEDPKGRP
jgi:hypothetical protein